MGQFALDWQDGLAPELGEARRFNVLSFAPIAPGGYLR